MNKIILASFFIVLTFSQTFGFGGIRTDQGSKPKTLPNCLNQKDGKCEKCADGYEPDANGQCQAISVDENFIPCGNQKNCG